MAFITLRQSRQLELSGWHRVTYGSDIGRYESANEWVRCHSRGRCHRRSWHYWFELEEDAVVFTLKWS